MSLSGREVDPANKIAEAADMTSATTGVASARLADRRALLKKLGRFGLYTAPALLLTFESAKAAALSGPPL